MMKSQRRSTCSGTTILSAILVCAVLSLALADNTAATPTTTTTSYTCDGLVPSQYQGNLTTIMVGSEQAPQLVASSTVVKEAALVLDGCAFRGLLLLINVTDLLMGAAARFGLANVSRLHVAVHGSRFADAALQITRDYNDAMPPIPWSAAVVGGAFEVTAGWALGDVAAGPLAVSGTFPTNSSVTIAATTVNFTQGIDITGWSASLSVAGIGVVSIASHEGFRPAVNVTGVQIQTREPLIGVPFGSLTGLLVDLPSTIAAGGVPLTTITHNSIDLQWTIYPSQQSSPACTGLSLNGLLSGGGDKPEGDGCEGLRQDTAAVTFMVVANNVTVTVDDRRTDEDLYLNMYGATITAIVADDDGGGSGAALVRGNTFTVRRTAPVTAAPAGGVLEIPAAVITLQGDTARLCFNNNTAAVLVAGPLLATTPTVTARSLNIYSEDAAASSASGNVFTVTLRDDSGPNPPPTTVATPSSVVPLVAPGSTVCAVEATLLTSAFVDNTARLSWPGVGAGGPTDLALAVFVATHSGYVPGPMTVSALRNTATVPLLSSSSAATGPVVPLVAVRVDTTIVVPGPAINVLHNTLRVGPGLGPVGALPNASVALVTMGDVTTRATFDLSGAAIVVLSNTLNVSLPGAGTVLGVALVRPDKASAHWLFNASTTLDVSDNVVATTARDPTSAVVAVDWRLGTITPDQPTDRLVVRACANVDTQTGAAPATIDGPTAIVGLNMSQLLVQMCPIVTTTTAVTTTTSEASTTAASASTTTPVTNPTSTTTPHSTTITAPEAAAAPPALRPAVVAAIGGGAAVIGALVGSLAVAVYCRRQQRLKANAKGQQPFLSERELE